MMQSPTFPEKSARSERAAVSSAGRGLWNEAMPLLITVVAGVVCYGLFIKRGLGLPILGYNISSAERVMHGEAAYRDFVYNYTPGVLWLNAGLMKLAGASVMAVNTSLFAFKLAALVVLFLVARRLTSGKAALIPVALTLGWIGYRVVLRPYPTQYSMLFLLLGLLCFLNYERSGRTRWLALCGAAAGVVFLFKQNVGVSLLVSATAGIFVRDGFALGGPGGWSRRVGAAARQAACCWAGFVIVTACVFAYVAHTGALGAMLGHFWRLAAEYGDKRATALPSMRLFASAIAILSACCVIGLIVLRKASKLFEAFVTLVLVVGASVLLIPGWADAIKNSATAAISYFPIALVILVFAGAAWQFRKSHLSSDRAERWWRSWGAILIVALFALAALSEMYPRADYAHLVRILPPLFLLLFLVSSRSVPVLTEYFRSYLPAPRRAALLSASVPLALLFVVGIKDTWQPRFDSSLRFLDQTPLNVERARGVLVGRKQARFIDHLAAAIEANSSPDEFIFSFAPRGTAFYFLTARRNPSRLIWWRSAGLRGEDREAMLGKLGDGIPKLVVVPEGFDNERALTHLNARYHQIDLVGDVKIYDRNQ